VVTETGDLLGKVRGYRFDITDGKLTSIIIAAIGIPLIPEQVVSTYELSIDEVISSGANRLIVFEGAEERLTQLSVGFLERLGLGKSWNEDEYYKPTVIAPANQLPAGTPVNPPPRIKRPETPVPVVNQWEEELEPIAPPTPKVREVKYYQVEEETGDRQPTNYQKAQYIPTNSPSPKNSPTRVPDPEIDYWNEEEEVIEERPMINIPQKVQQVEYHEDDL
jgi:sporulation protein YlmC with PRC-barrel domain